jgi:hypothetical protein
MTSTPLIPPLPVLAVQIVAAVGWIGAYMLWGSIFYRAVDPWLRRRVGAWAGAEVIWIYRRGSLYASPLSFTLRRSTWSWALAGDRSQAVLRDGFVYVLYVLLVPVLAGIAPIAALAYVALWRHALSVVVLLPLFCLVIPLYWRYWGGSVAAPGMVRPAAT